MIKIVIGFLQIMDLEQCLNTAICIYIRKKYIKDLIVTTHENALTGYRNDIEDFDNLSIEIYNVKIEKNGKMVTPEANNPKRPSNMLELKW